MPSAIGSCLVNMRGGGGSLVPDTYYNDVTCFMNFNDKYNSYLDLVGNIWTPVGTTLPTIQTTTPILGTGSLSFPTYSSGDATSQITTVPTLGANLPQGRGNFELSGIDFTLEISFNYKGTGGNTYGYAALMGLANSSTTTTMSWYIGLKTNGTDIVFCYGNTSTSNLVRISTGISFSLNTNHNLVFSRIGSNMYMFLDGVCVKTITTLPTTFHTDPSYPAWIGGNANASYYGLIDSIRITQGIGRYTPLTINTDTYKTTVLADSPLAYWKMDETSGTILTDSSGHGYNGTYGILSQINGPKLISSGNGMQCSYSGSNIYAEGALIPDSTALRLVGSACSFEFWLQTTNTITGTLISKQLLGVNYPSWAINITSSGKIQVSLFSNNSSGGNFLNFNSSASVNDGLIKHVVITLDGTSVLKIYINNVLDSTTSYSGTLWSNTDAIGILVPNTTSGNASYPIAAVIDEVAIYNTVLTSTRVSAHYTAGTTHSSYSSQNPLVQPSTFGYLPVNATPTTITNMPSIPLLYSEDFTTTAISGTTYSLLASSGFSAGPQHTTVVSDTINKVLKIESGNGDYFVSWDKWGYMANGVLAIEQDIIITKDNTGNKTIGIFLNSGGSSGMNGYVFISSMSGGNTSYYITKLINNVRHDYTHLTDSGVPLVIGTTYTFRLEYLPNGYLTAYINKVLVGRIIDTTFDVTLNTFKPGFYNYGNTSQITGLRVYSNG
jgi:hypothetical protein